MSTLTKAEMTLILNEEMGFSKREAREIVDQFFMILSEALTRGENVKIAGFGSFQLRQRPPRPGRNPKTGELVPIPARRVVSFVPSQRLKERLQGTAE